MTELKIYTVPELIEILKVTNRTLHRYLNAGKLKGFKVGHNWRVKHEDLMAFINGGTGT